LQAKRQANKAKAFLIVAETPQINGNATYNQNAINAIGEVGFLFMLCLLLDKHHLTHQNHRV
jgi:hypothetical protein